MASLQILINVMEKSKAGCRACGGRRKRGSQVGRQGRFPVDVTFEERTV